jgi:hypothetical protein
MTLVLMEGFEDITETSDLTPARGWTVPANNSGLGTGVMTVPSRTPVPGRGLYLRGPYNTGVGVPMASVNASDFGMLSTGKSINSLWNAGGFAVGFNATFNRALNTLVAANYNYQIAYDGAQYYWAIFYTGNSTYSVGYSTDLINWTAVQAVPSLLTAGSSITVLGSGSSATIIIGQTPASGSGVGSYQYSTNMGVSWTAVALSTWTYRPIPGNTNAPLVCPYYNGSSAPTIYAFNSVSSGTGVATGVVLATYVSGNTYHVVSKVVAGILCFCAWSTTSATSVPNSTATSYWVTAPQTANLAQSASYTPGAANTGGLANDITFFNNTWISVGYGGIYTAPNPGTVSVPAGPTGAWTQRAVNAGLTVWSVDCNSNICVAVGEDSSTGNGAIWTSTNGTTWTKVTRFLLSSTASVFFNSVFWNGSVFVATGQGNGNAIITSPDGLVWSGVFYPDFAEATVPGTNSFLGVYSGTIVAGVYKPTFTSAGFVTAVGILPAAVSAGARVVAPCTLTTGTGTENTTTPTASVPVSTLSHYYELIFTATSTVNAFTAQWALDGVIVGSIALPANGLGSTGDTTGSAQLLINLPRNGQFTVIDDIYVTTMNGANNVGQLGVCNIVPHIGTADVQDQFTKNGTAASNAASASGNSLANAVNSVSTYTTPAKDIYSSSSQIPANYRVKAVQVEGYLTRAGTVASSGTIGLISGSTEVDSATVAANSATPAYASVICELDPSTGAAWTPAGANAVELVVTKVT